MGASFWALTTVALVFYRCIYPFKELHIYMPDPDAICQPADFYPIICTLSSTANAASLNELDASRRRVPTDIGVS